MRCELYYRQRYVQKVVFLRTELSEYTGRIVAWVKWRGESGIWDEHLLRQRIKNLPHEDTETERWILNLILEEEREFEETMGLTRDKTDDTG